MVKRSFFLLQKPVPGLVRTGPRGSGDHLESLEVLLDFQTAAEFVALFVPGCVVVDRRTVHSALQRSTSYLFISFAGGGGRVHVCVHVCLK